MLTPLLTLVATVAVLLAVVWLCQRRLIYFPRSQDVPPVASILAGAEEISFDTPDGLRLECLAHGGPADLMRAAEIVLAERGRWRQHATQDVAFNATITL